jgi:hypothetical protein
MRVLAGGLAVGISASAIFVVLLAAIAVHMRFPRMIPPDGAIMIIVTALALAGGLTFAALVACRRGEPVLRWRTLAIGVVLPVTGLGGLLLAAKVEPLGTSRADLTLPVFRTAFVSASVLVAFVCTCAAALLLRVPAAVRCALAVAAVTGVTYLLLAVVLDPMPGFHVGGGDRAMPKVALICNLLAGLAGGSVAFRVLSRRSRPAII